jgi:hypothetical protein
MLRSLSFEADFEKQKRYQLGATPPSVWQRRGHALINLDSSANEGRSTLIGASRISTSNQ